MITINIDGVENDKKYAIANEEDEILVQFDDLSNLNKYLNNMPFEQDKYLWEKDKNGKLKKRYLERFNQYLHMYKHALKLNVNIDYFKWISKQENYPQIVLTKYLEDKGFENIPNIGIDTRSPKKDINLINFIYEAFEKGYNANQIKNYIDLIDNQIFDTCFISKIYHPLRDFVENTTRGKCRVSLVRDDFEIIEKYKNPMEYDFKTEFEKYTVFEVCQNDIVYYRTDNAIIVEIENNEKYKVCFKDGTNKIFKTEFEAKNEIEKAVYNVGIIIDYKRRIYKNKGISNSGLIVPSRKTSKKYKYATTKNISLSEFNSKEKFESFLNEKIVLDANQSIIFTIDSEEKIADFYLSNKNMYIVYLDKFGNVYLESIDNYIKNEDNSIWIGEWDYCKLQIHKNITEDC